MDGSRGAIRERERGSDPDFKVRDGCVLAYVEYVEYAES